MAVEFKLPDIGEGLEEAEVVEWLVRPGDTVARDQAVVEVLTDKSQTQLPSPVSGTVARLAFAEGERVKVGQVLFVIDDGTGAVQRTAPEGDGVLPPPAAVEPNGAARPAPAAALAAAVPAAVPVATAVVAGSPLGRPKAAPAVRRRARDAGIDLGAVTGTGPGGRITQADLDAASDPAAARAVPAAAPAQAAGDGAPLPAVRATPPPLGQMAAGVHPLTGIRRVIAESMERSWAIPHIHGFDEIDATELLAARDRLRAAGGDMTARLSVLPLMVMAVAQALRRYPMVNASIDTAAGTITVHPDVNVGVAVATELGLVVPVVRQADRRGLLDLAVEIDRLATAARARTIAVDDLRHGTCTVTNYGSLGGGRYAAPIIRAPEVAIVGFGAIAARPIVVDGEVVARPTLPIAVGADHRLVDGDLSGAFQRQVSTLLADPVALLLER